MHATALAPRPRPGANGSPRSHRALAVWVALVPLAIALAGCAAEEPTPTQAPTPATVTDPRDVAASANGSHLHDYWQGRDRIDVVSATSPQSSLTAPNGDLVMATFRPEDGLIVPQGTASVVVEVQWHPGSGFLVPLPTDNDYHRLELWVKTAAHEATKVAVLDGTPITMASTDDDNDPPHYLLSLWEFEVHAVKDDGSQVTAAGSATLKATAVRGLPLRAFPAHPDHWQGRAEMPVLSSEGMVQESAAAGLMFCTASCMPTMAPETGVIVPPETATVRVELTIQPTSTPVPLRLLYHGADTRAWQVGATGLITGTTIIDLPAAGMGDSPYAKSSLWELRLERDLPAPDGAWAGEYTLAAVAVRG